VNNYGFVSAFLSSVRVEVVKIGMGRNVKGVKKGGKSRYQAIK
jgi:hypothetical protein